MAHINYKTHCLPIKAEQTKQREVKSLKLRKEWEVLSAKLEAAPTDVDAMSILHDLLLTPKYSIAKVESYDSKTGKAIKIKWVKQQSSRMLQYIYIPGTVGNIKLPKCLTKRFAKELTLIEKTGQPLIYVSSSSDMNAEVFRSVVISRDYICTGGGHNDSSTYDYVLRISPGFSIYELLSNKRRI